MEANYKIAMLLLGLFVATTGYGQSLGDVAREQRQKQQAKKADAAPKVITNEDMPEHSESDTDTSSSNSGSGDPLAHSAADFARSGDQFKATIQAQKSAIASLQSQVDKLNESIHFVAASRYSNGVQYNQYQMKKKQEVERAQKQLDDQKKKLAEMQEAARKAGFGSAVYDP